MKQIFYTNRNEKIVNQFLQGENQAEIGREFKISRERVRQILNKSGIFKSIKQKKGFKEEWGELIYYKIYGLPNKIKRQIFERDNFICQYCGKGYPFVKLVVDHKIPTSRGGTHDFSNLTTACSKCNTRKVYKTDKEFINHEKIKFPTFGREEIKEQSY